MSDNPRGGGGGVLGLIFAGYVHRYRDRLDKRSILKRGSDGDRDRDRLDKRSIKNRQGKELFLRAYIGAMCDLPCLGQKGLKTDPKTLLRIKIVSRNT